MKKVEIQLGDVTYKASKISVLFPSYWARFVIILTLALQPAVQLLLTEV